MTDRFSDPTYTEEELIRHIKVDCRFWNKAAVIRFICDFLGYKKVEAETLYTEYKLEDSIDKSLNPKGRKKDQMKWLKYI